MDTLELAIKTDRLSLVPISLNYCNYIFKEFTKQITVFIFPQPTGKIDDIIMLINKSPIFSIYLKEGGAKLLWSISYLLVLLQKSLHI